MRQHTHIPAPCNHHVTTTPLLPLLLRLPRCLLLPLLLLLPCIDRVERDAGVRAARCALTRRMTTAAVRRLGTAGAVFPHLSSVRCQPWRLAAADVVGSLSASRPISARAIEQLRTDFRREKRRLSLPPVAATAAAVGSHGHSDMSPPLLSSSLPTLCRRCVADSTLPPPPCFPVLSRPLTGRSARLVSDLLFTPAALRLWPSYSSDINCPLLVDHANLLLALAHLTAARKGKRRLRHAAAVTFEQQRRPLSVEQLTAVEWRARRAIDGALRASGSRLTPLPGWTQQDVLAVRAVRGERGRQHLRWPHPRFTHHQLKQVDMIERDRARRDASELERERERQQHRTAEQVGGGLKAWQVELAERGSVSPAKWRVPRHMRWLLWKRSQARQAEAAWRQQRGQQRQVAASEASGWH